jgi:lipoprotein-releasing system permease protein
MGYEYFIGSRYIRAGHKHRFISLITILSIAGVTVGVMALIVVIAVMAGFASDLKTRILGVQSHLVITRYGETIRETGAVMDAIQGVPGVTAATPFIYSQAMLRSSSGVSGAVLRGVDPKSVGSVIPYFEGLSFDSAAGGPHATPGGGNIPGIILGGELARKLGIIKGETVFLISPKGVLSPVGHLPAMKRFRVTDIFTSGMYEFDNNLAFITIAEAQRLLRMTEGVTGIEVKVDDIYKAADIGNAIREKLGFPFWARDWMQMNRNLFSALKLEKTVMFIILTLIILVAAFNIASSLIMMVMEKRKDIAILKAMGATDASIRKIFIFEGMVIGTIGTSLGAALGILLCVLLGQYNFIELPKDVYYITNLPVQLNMLDVGLIAISSLAICFVATLYPARQASRMDPVEALRYG